MADITLYATVKKNGGHAVRPCPVAVGIMVDWTCCFLKIGPKKDIFSLYDA